MEKKAPKSSSVKPGGATPKSSSAKPASSSKPSSSTISKPPSSSSSVPKPKASSVPAKTKPPSKKPATTPSSTKKPPSKPAATPTSTPTATPTPIVSQPDPAKQAELEKQLEELRQSAWIAEVEQSRRAEEEKRQRAELEAKRRRDLATWTASLLEAAYDDDMNVFVTEQVMSRAAELLPHPDKVIETADAHGNTLLSEAAAGGALHVVEWLLARGANPNQRGQFSRTPLWRASFLGKTSVLMPLLQGGADPRLANESGELPLHVASNDEIRDVLAAWPIQETDRLIATWRAARQGEATMRQEAAARRQAGAQERLDEAQRLATQAQQQLCYAHNELEKRIHEYDTIVQEHKPETLCQVALAQIHEYEALLKQAKERARERNETLAMAKVALRDEQKAKRAADLARLRMESDSTEALDAVVAAEEEEEEERLGLAVKIRDLEDVLLKDSTGKLAASHTWPALIDPSGQASVFLRYLDSNYCNVLSIHHMEPHRLRKSILGAIRYGKPLVLDVLDADVYDTLTSCIDAVAPNLFASLLDRSLLQNERYLTLVRPDDGDEYERGCFVEERMRNFLLVLLIGIMPPHESFAPLLDRMSVFRVQVAP